MYSRNLRKYQKTRKDLFRYIGLIKILRSIKITLDKLQHAKLLKIELIDNLERYWHQLLDHIMH